MIIITRQASEITEGTVLTDAEGRYTRVVVGVDLFSNSYGKIILRTAVRADAKATGSTVVSAWDDLHVMVKR